MEDHSPTAGTMEKLRAVFGEALPEVETETDRRRRYGEETAAKYLPLMHGPQARAKASASRRGLPRDQAASAKALETMRSSGAMDRSVAAMKRWMASPRGRAMLRLTRRLRWHPSPSREVLHQWAADAGAQIGLSDAAMMAIWRPALQARGLISRAGRKANEARCTIVREEMASGPRYWNEAARRVAESEHISVGSAEDFASFRKSLQEWFRLHRKSCPDIGRA